MERIRSCLGETQKTLEEEENASRIQDEKQEIPIIILTKKEKKN